MKRIYLFLLMLSITPALANRALTLNHFAAVDAVNDTGTTAYAGETTIAVANVLSNDTFSGGPVSTSLVHLTLLSSAIHPGVTLNTVTGAVTVGADVPVGTYILQYQICAIYLPNDCDYGVVTITVAATPVINAVNDITTTAYTGCSTAVGNVLSNDTYAGVPATTSLVSLTLLSSAIHPSVTLNTVTGAVNVGADVPVGTYTLQYTLCAKANSANCDYASVTVNVLAAPTINAADDNFTVSSIISTQNGGTTTSVLTNDTFNGSSYVAGQGIVSLTYTAGLPGVSITQSGVISIGAGATPGNYTLKYKICKSCYCDEATVTIKVISIPTIDAVNDTAITAYTGYQTVVVNNVRANDTYNGVAATTSNVTTTLVSTLPSGISFNTTTGAVTVETTAAAGTYTITYKICSIAAPTTNCDNATITITVLTTPVINAVDDLNLTAYAGCAATVLVNVRANDTFNGVPATSANVSLQQLTSPTSPFITLNSTTGAVNVGSQVPVGNYTIQYQICSITHPNSNCDAATVTITVLAPPVINAVNDNYLGVDIDAENGGSTPSVFINDTYNGNPYSIGQANVYLSDGAGIPNITLGQDGVITIGPGAESGNYTIQYSICLNSCICDTGAVQIYIKPTLDTNGFRANNDVKIAKLQSTGKIIVSGYFTNYGNINNNGFIRLNSDLTQDNSFAATGPPAGSTASMSVNTIEVLNDDSILVGGGFSGFNGVNQKALVLLKDDGSINTDFNYGEQGFYHSPPSYPYVKSIAVRPDGRLVVIGHFEKYNGVDANKIIGLKSDGSIDPDFYYGSGFSGPSGGGLPKIVMMQGDKIIVAGSISGYQGYQAHQLIRLNSNGDIDDSFIQSEIDSYVVTEFEINSIYMYSNGDMLVGGRFDKYNGEQRENLVKIFADGTLDMNFHSGDFEGSTGSNVYSITLDENGKIIVGGRFESFDGYSVHQMMRLNSNGTFDSGFSIGTGPESPNSSEYVSVLTKQPNGKIIVGGRFNLFDGIYAGHITRLIPATGIQGRGINYFTSEPAIDAQANNIVLQSIGVMTAPLVNIYPNPSTGIFTLDMKGYEGQTFELIIHNALGQLIHQTTLKPENAYQLDLTNFQNGNYFVRLQNNNTTINKIITKK